MRLRLLIAAAWIIGLFLIGPGAAPAAPGGLTYLPLIARDEQVNTIFGIEMGQISPTTGLDLVLTSGTRWVRRNGLLWSEIEPVEGAGYRWDSPATQRIEAEMIAASSNRLNLVLVVRGSPKWAVTPYMADCAPVSPAKYSAYAKFLAAAVERYSKPPYNVRYWELGNEPDAPLLPIDYVFGCWGMEDDPYFGGRAYGEMLRAVYPSIKQASPAVQVLNGGLLLDHAYVDTRPDDTPGRFFEGMLVAGAGRSFDIVSFHTYNYFSAGSQPYGPPSDWRVPYLRDLLRQYGIPAKPMMRTETALLCVEVTPECRWAQADAVARTFVSSMRDDLLANLWYVYDNDSYHNTALIEPGDVFVPRPAYFAYRHAARLLSGTTYVGPQPDLPTGVSAYRFQANNEVILIYWTDAAQALPFTIALPSGAAISCTERDGGPSSCTQEGNRLTLSAQRSPAFVVIK